MGEQEKKCFLKLFSVLSVLLGVIFIPCFILSLETSFLNFCFLVLKFIC